MIRSRKFFAFLIFVCFVVGYAIYDFQSDRQAQRLKVEQSQLLKINSDQIQRIEYSSTGQEFVLQRTPEGWKFVKPRAETADQESVAQFIAGIATEKSTAKVEGEKGTIDLKIYGLDQPKAVVTLLDNSQNITKYSISDKKNFQGESYLRINDEQNVMVASASWLQKANKVWDDFRDRRWARINIAEIVRAKLERGREHFTLVKEKDDWTVEGKPDWKIDQNKVRKFVSGFSGNRIQKFEIAPDSKPLMTIELTLKDGKKWHGRFGINKDKKHFAEIPSLQMTVEIQTEDGTDLYRLSDDYFRDRSVPFQFEKADVKQIDYLGPAKKFTLELVGEKWQLGNGSDASKEVDDEQVKSVLNKLNGLEILDFLEGKGAKGLPKNTSGLVLKGKDGKVVFEFKWGGLFSKKVAGSDKGVFVAHTSAYPSDFSIDEAAISGLGLEKVLVDKKSERAQTRSEVSK